MFWARIVGSKIIARGDSIKINADSYCEFLGKTFF